MHIIYFEYKMICFVFQMLSIKINWPLSQVSGLLAGLAALLNVAAADTDRTLDVGRGISGIVNGGFDKLGYIPIAEAVGMCEGQARRR